MMMRKRVAAAVMGAFILFTLSGCGMWRESTNEIHSYGVFLSVDKDLGQLEDYRTVVIDAQYFDADEIKAFKDNGHVVYSYINVGALEDFRDYYAVYRDISLGEYEHWEEEVWMDVSDVRWQEFILDELAPSLAEKGIDGFFVDNCDVYYQYENEKIFEGLTVIMRGLIGFDIDVIINGGDVYLDAYTGAYGNCKDVVTGINQETVFTKISWEDGSFSRASEEDREYFTEYLERYSEPGVKIFLLEYTADEALIKDISEYCDKHGYLYYVSDSIELLSPV